MILLQKKKNQKPKMANTQKTKEVFGGQKISDDWFTTTIGKDIPNIVKEKAEQLPSEANSQKDEEKQ